VKKISAKEAAEMIQDNSRVGIGGFVGIAVAEEIYKAIEHRFLTTGAPRDLSLFFVAGQGNGAEKGLSHFAYEGLLKRTVGAHYGLSPSLQTLVAENKIEAYNFPQGILNQLLRTMAGRKGYAISKVGLHTFVDPELEGGKLNSKTVKDLVKKTQIDGHDYLLYKTGRFDFVILRGTYADEHGNICMEKEALKIENLPMAMAAHNTGGKVIVQVEKIVPNGTLDPKNVVIPSICVDYVVEVEDMKNHMQTFAEDFNPDYVSSKPIPKGEFKPYPLNERKIIARRAAQFLTKDMKVLNFGIGLPEVVAQVIEEEGISDNFTPTVEPGGIGGIAAGGLSFGALSAPQAILDHAYQFDFYDGGGLDITFLGMAECDIFGNVNVSKFGPKIAGCGGFIDISQNTHNVVFCGTFMAGKMQFETGNGEFKIISDGKVPKLIDFVEQITFSGEYAKEKQQVVHYVTERAVFAITSEGFTLIEIAPGVDLESDVLAHMSFKPIISKELKLMDARIFKAEKMGIEL